MWYAEKMVSLLNLQFCTPEKGSGCKGIGPPEIPINVVSKSCKSCNLTSVTCRKILFYACAACSFARQLLKRLRTPKVFSFVCTPHAEKNLSTRRRSSGLSAWNANWVRCRSSIESSLSIVINSGVKVYR